MTRRPCATEKGEMAREGQQDFLDVKRRKGVLATHALYRGLTTGLGRPCSNMGGAQEVQRWKPEEQPKLAPGITRGFKFFFSQTAAISLCRAQGIMDVVFMPGLHFTFPRSPPAAEESVSHCCLNTPTMVLVAAATPKSTLVYLLGKGVQPPKGIC